MQENKFPENRHLHRAIEKLTSEDRLTVEELEEDFVVGISLVWSTAISCCEQ